MRSFRLSTTTCSRSIVVVLVLVVLLGTAIDVTYGDNQNHEQKQQQQQQQQDGSCIVNNDNNNIDRNNKYCDKQMELLRRELQECKQSKSLSNQQIESELFMEYEKAKKITYDALLLFNEIQRQFKEEVDGITTTTTTTNDSNESSSLIQQKERIDDDDGGTSTTEADDNYDEADGDNDDNPYTRLVANLERMWQIRLNVAERKLTILEEIHGISL